MDFPHAQSDEKYAWKLHRFSHDNPPRIFISPRFSQRQYPPPYHLECVLEEKGTFAQTLLMASDYVGPVVPKDDINRILKTIRNRLEKWSAHIHVQDVLRTIPLGSRFHLDDEEDHEPRGHGIWLSPNYQLERKYHTISSLMRLWSATELPPCLDLEQVQCVSRLHDSVSLVILPNGEQAIFKGVVQGADRMYHELKVLLSMPSHPNIIGRPRHIILRKIQSMEEPIVCGFVLPYHSGGTLLEAIAKHNPLTIQVKVKWMRQILSAFRHIHSRAGTFYSDLRLDNIVLTKEEDVVLIDFEQHGSAQRWLHPKLWRTNTTRPSAGCDSKWCASRINPVNMPRGTRYCNPPHGYWTRFIVASDLQQQAYESFTLSKVMWCIFEQKTNDFSLLELNEEEKQMICEGGTPIVEKAFPHFVMTPPALRYWIWLCTNQSSEWGVLQCNCARTGISAGLCPETGARMHCSVGGILDGPGIFDTHAYFENWATETVGTGTKASV